MSRSVSVVGQLVALCAVGFGVLEAKAAELYWQKVEGHVQIFVEGHIRDGDEVEFRNLIMRLANSGQIISHVTVFSPGGSVLPALSIGRQIRTLRLSTADPMRNPQVGPDTVHCYRRSYTEDGKVLAPHLHRHWSRNTPRCLILELPHAASAAVAA